LTGLLVNLTRAIPEGAFLGAADSYLRVRPETSSRIA
jgi:hypothetical protein